VSRGSPGAGVETGIAPAIGCNPTVVGSTPGGNASESARAIPGRQASRTTVQLASIAEVRRTLQ
jgi:hypothetical protein